MAGVLHTASLVCTVLGLVSSAATLLRSRDVRLSLGVLLDFLLAAGLLRLSTDATTRALLAAAAVVVIRKIATSALRTDGTPQRPALSSRAGRG